MLPSNKMKEMERKDKFHFLMDLIEKNYDDISKRDPNTGTFSFLQNNLYMRHIPITPSKSVRPEQLKTFLAIQVLHIYPVNNYSKVTYLTIQKYLDGENDRNYIYQFELLDECFDIEKNRETAAKQSFLIGKDPVLVETALKSDVWFPYILVKQIEKIAAQKLLDYWKLCDKNWEAKKSDGNEADDKKLNDKMKEKVYREILMAITLQEIFVQECFFDNTLQIIEEGYQYLDVIKEDSDKFVLLIERVREGEAVKEELVDEGERIHTDLAKLSGDVNNICTIFLLTMEYLVGMFTHLELVMMFESINIRSESGKRMKKYYENLHGKNMNYPFYWNKNKSKYYKQMLEFVEEELIRYIVQNGCGDYHKAVVNYFKLIEHKDDKYSKKLWETKCTIARPLLTKGGENEDEK